jgi:sulfur-oxidizing protein SoxZ
MTPEESAMPATRIVVPAKARKGEVIEIKTIINHVMETGYRRDNAGNAIPRNIITRFACTYAGEEVFSMDLFTGVAANPFVGFTTIAVASGDVVFEWTDEHGSVTREVAHIIVS